MQYKNESQLYKEVSAAMKEMKRKMKGAPFWESAVDGEMEYIERKVEAHNLHLIGEHHLSKKPVECIHNKIVPQIQSSTGDWLVLNEEKEKIKSAIDAPKDFYLQELVKLYDLPYEYAIGNLRDPETREYIKRKSKINEETLDKIMVTVSMMPIIEMGMSSVLFGPYLPRFVKQTSKMLGKPKEYTRRLVLKGPKKNFQFEDFEEVVAKPWNEYSHERIHKLLKDYPDRKEVLVVVGAGHLPVFK